MNNIILFMIGGAFITIVTGTVTSNNTYDGQRLRYNSNKYGHEPSASYSKLLSLANA